MTVSRFLILFVFPAILFLLNNFKDTSVESGSPLINSKIKNWTREEVLKDPKFYFLLPTVLCPPFLITGIFINQSFLFVNKGWGFEMIAMSFTAYAVFTVISLQISGFLIDKFSAIKILPFYLLPMMVGFLLTLLFDLGISPILFFILIAITNGTANVLITSTWSEIYGTKHLGAIRSVTVSFMVFSTALAPILFGNLIDLGFSTNEIIASMLLYSIVSNLLFLAKIKSYKPVISA